MQVIASKCFSYAKHRYQAGDTVKVTDADGRVLIAVGMATRPPKPPTLRKRGKSAESPSEPAPTPSPVEPAPIPTPVPDPFESPDIV